MRHLIALTALLACTLTAQTNAVDLTYSFDEKTIYWPTAKPFEWQKESWGRNTQGAWYAAGRYAASEHVGTHLDSPVHFAEGQAATDQIPLSHLMGPAAVIDIAASSARNPDYRMTVADVTAWEKLHGRIPDGAIVLVRTGWGKFWPDRKRYLGTDQPGDTANLHFPGVSKEAAEFLTRNRKIYGVGIDTASLDYGPSRDFATHRILNEAGVYGLENVASLEKVPATGARIIALPMKIKGGSGAPVRIVALLP
jgi:kynurenine formamidase